MTELTNQRNAVAVLLLVAGLLYLAGCGSGNQATREKPRETVTPAPANPQPNPQPDQQSDQQPDPAKFAQYSRVSSFVDPAYRGRSFSSIMVYNPTDRMADREILETIAVNYMRRNYPSLTVYRSLDTFPPTRTYGVEDVVNGMKESDVMLLIIQMKDVHIGSNRRIGNYALPPEITANSTATLVDPKTAATAWKAELFSRFPSDDVNHALMIATHNTCYALANSGLLAVR